MDCPVLTDLEEKCRNIGDEGDSFFSWSWDDRFETVLSTFHRENAEKAEGIFRRHFSDCWLPKSMAFWDKARINNAPAIVRTAAETAGGLSKGQMLFTSDSKNDVLMFGAWWPWGDGDTISIRIGLLSQRPDISREEILLKVREWFDL